MNKYSEFKSQLKPIIPGFKTKLIYGSDSSDEVILCVFWSILSFFKDWFHLKKKYTSKSLIETTETSKINSI